MEKLLARLASQAHGIVTRRELLDAEVTRDQIRDRVRKGLLIREFPGVYRVGHCAESIEATYMAAVKACGKRAVLSGLAAAYLCGLIGRPPSLPEVTTPTERKVKGIGTRRGKLVERTSHRNIPVTTVARTLVDLAARLDEEALTRACHKAVVKFRTTPRQVEAVLRRHPNSPGAAKLRRAIRGDSHLILSALERRFLQLLREADLPLPLTNRPKDGRYIDCRWPDHRLTVELDSYRFHNTRYAWEQDRRCEREAYARGDQFRRYTWGDVFEAPNATITELKPLLGAGS